MVLSPAPPPGCTAVQGAASSTFTPPPLDGSMYIAEMVDWHLEKSAEHPYMVLVGEDTEENVIITWGEAARAVHRLTAKILESLPNGPADEEGRPRVVGLLVNLDTLIYLTTVFAVLRAGLQPFPLSTRNSLPALRHLVESTHCAFLIGSVPRSSTHSALEETTESLLSAIPSLKLLDVPTCSELYPRLSGQAHDPYDREQDRKATPALPALRSLSSFQHASDRWPCTILHSSGTTSFPKPLRLSDRVVRSVGTAFWYGDLDLCGTTWALMSLPSFHGMGIGFGGFIALTTGLIVAAFKPSNNARVPTPEATLHATERSKADYLMAPPSFCETWSQDVEAIKRLVSLKSLIYGGGPLPQKAGDRLVAGGVTLQSAYGTTEAGIISRTLSSQLLKGPDWAYMQFSHSLIPRLVHEDGRVYRLILQENAVHPCLSEYNVAGEAALDLNDLVEEHPVHKGYWKIVGRADDQIMMSNGEKTNPGPIESIIAANDGVRTAMMFGRSRTQSGVAIEPVRYVDIDDDADVERFRNEIWPDVEKANAFAPAHSRIFKEFILVADPVKKPFVRTAKSNLSRNATLKLYAEEIDALYDAAEQPTKAEWAQLPEDWDEDHLRAFVLRVANGVMRPQASKRGAVDPERDLFEQGCDSLQATYIRNALGNAIRHAPKRPTDSRNKRASPLIPQNLVFIRPTVTQLADFVFQHVKGTVPAESLEDDQSKQVAAMLAMVEKYTTDFAAHMPNEVALRHLDGEVVLLTGSTGTLGSYLLRTLLLDPKVSLVYAVNRPSQGKSLEERQREAFEDRGVDSTLLQSPKLRLVQADLSSGDLSVNTSLLEEMRSSITIIIHNAWRLDFNLGLSAFEPQVQATRSLVDLALSSPHAEPPQCIFTSSVGTVLNWKRDSPVPEEAIDDPYVALGTGYGEAKWIVERVLIAAAQKGLKSTVWRVGQLAGSTVNGAWNTTDWVPIIVKASEVMGVLPSMAGATISWLPTDKAAETIVDVSHNPPPTAGARYLHLVHPYPVKWDVAFNAMSRALFIPLVPYEQWFASVESAAQKNGTEIERNPAIKLLDFFRAGTLPRTTSSGAKLNGSSSKEAMRVPDLDTSKAVQLSTTLASLEPLNANDTERWMAYWSKYSLVTTGI